MRSYFSLKRSAIQAMVPTNIKTVHETSLLHIERSLDRLGLLSSTHKRSQQQQEDKVADVGKAGAY